MVRRNENIEITLGSSKNAVSRWYSDLKYTGLSQFRKSEKKKKLPLSFVDPEQCSSILLFYLQIFFFFTSVFLFSSFLVSQDFCIFAMSGTRLSEFRLKCVEGQHFLV